MILFRMSQRVGCGNCGEPYGCFEGINFFVRKNKVLLPNSSHRSSSFSINMFRTSTPIYKRSVADRLKEQSQKNAASLMTMTTPSPPPMSTHTTKDESTVTTNVKALVSSIVQDFDASLPKTMDCHHLIPSCTMERG